MVTALEKAPTQSAFMKKVATQLGCDNFNLVRGDALKYIEASCAKFDIIFADPPYDLKGFGEIPEKVLNSKMLKPGTIFIIEHSRNYDFSHLPHFSSHRTYGSVNFSIFEIEE